MTWADLGDLPVGFAGFVVMCAVVIVHDFARYIARESGWDPCRRRWYR